MFKRAHHRRIHSVLASMNGDFLQEAGCCFGGGTCLALRLDEYRESADMDFLCASIDGYRAIRGTITNLSLGDLFDLPPTLLREVRADRYGVRCVLSVDGIAVKFEIVLEGRVPLQCERIDMLPVPVLDRTGSFVEKLLANADRYADRGAYSRDIIDLLVMLDRWGPIPDQAWSRAKAAYGEGVEADFGRAVNLLRDDPEYLERCFDTLDLTPAARGVVRDYLDGLPG